MVSLLFSSCSPDIDISVDETMSADETITTNSGIQDLNIPSGFNFSTKQEVIVNIIDESNYVKYDIYAYSNEKHLKGTETFKNQKGEIVTETVYKSDVLQKLVFSGVVRKGKLTQMISIPSYYNKLYIRRNENLQYSSSIENIKNGIVDFEYSAKSKTSKDVDVVDLLYCVNGSAELFQVDPLNGDLTYISDMPMGS